jgi:hypothetical protein
VIRYTKIAADGSDLPADAEGHQVVRVERDILARPLFVTAAIATESMTWQEAKAWAEGLTINGWSWRLPTVEEAFMIPDRSRAEEPALDPAFFPGNDGRWIWTATEDAQPPAGYAWAVDLVVGNSYRLHQGYRLHALAVRAGQF